MSNEEKPQQEGMLQIEISPDSRIKYRGFCFIFAYV